MIKKGKIGEYAVEVVFCNEKEYDGKGFLFKCCDGCVHNQLKK